MPFRHPNGSVFAPLASKFSTTSSMKDEQKDDDPNDPYTQTALTSPPSQWSSSHIFPERWNTTTSLTSSRGNTTSSSSLEHPQRGSSPTKHSVEDDVSSSSSCGGGSWSTSSLLEVNNINSEPFFMKKCTFKKDTLELPKSSLEDVSQTSLLSPNNNNNNNNNNNLNSYHNFPKRRNKNAMENALNSQNKDHSRMRRTLDSYNSILQQKQQVKKDPKFESQLHAYAQQRLGQDQVVFSYGKDNNKILDVDDLLNGIFDIDEAKRIRANKSKTTNRHHSHPHGHHPCLLDAHPISSSISSHNSLSNALFMKEQMKATNKTTPRAMESANFNQQYAQFLTSKSVKLISDVRKSTEQNCRAVQDVLSYQQMVDPELKAKVKKNLELMQDSLAQMEKAQEKKTEERKRLLLSRRQHRHSIK
nr:unnamed protein product [Naegleria fowleri]